jgi:hypothetical protein
MAKQTHDEASESLDAAIEAAIAQALEGDEVPAGAGTTKSGRVRRHKDGILALKARGWTWEAIAKKLAAAGLEVSARTVRLEIDKAKKRPEKATQLRRARVAAPKAKTPSVAPAAPTVQDRAAPFHGTEADFYTIKEGDV